MQSGSFSITMTLTQWVVVLVFLGGMVSTQGIIMSKVYDIPPKWFKERVDKLEERIDKECK